MNVAERERRMAATLPEGSVVAVLLEQHARIRDLFEKVGYSKGEEKQDAFDELRALLAVHEAGEEIVVRPTAAKAAGEQEAEARNDEEKRAAADLAELEKLDVESPEFTERFAAFERAVSDHADQEENEEFPQLLSECDEQTQRKLGKRLSAAQKVAPTHPHPGATGSRAAVMATGPFAALLDRARDAFKQSG